MNPEIQNNFEKSGNIELASEPEVVVDGMEVEPNSLDEDEVGRNFWMHTRDDKTDPDYKVKNWDGRVGYREGKVYIIMCTTLGTKAEPIFIVEEMRRRKFKKLLNYNQNNKDFRQQNESLVPLQNFVKNHIETLLTPNTET